MPSESSPFKVIPLFVRAVFDEVQIRLYTQNEIWVDVSHIMLQVLVYLII